MLISVCIPCKNRTYDLRKTLPFVIETANQSPPVEIVVLDYNSQDDLADYIKECQKIPLSEGNSLKYFKYTGCDYYRIAHAYNLNAKLTTGDWIVILGADVILNPGYFEAIREHSDATWIHCVVSKGVLAIKREEFMNSGGYDERFEWYGPEDKDFEERLIRRGGTLFIIPRALISEIYTPREEKLKNYQPDIEQSREKTKMAMRQIYFDNLEKKVLVANEGKEWGKE